MISLWWKLATAGIGPLIADWGWPLLAIAIIIALEFCMGYITALVPIPNTFVTALRKDLLWVAIVIAVALAWGAKMQHDEKLRCAAKAAAVDNAVTDAVTKAQKQQGLDRWDTDR